MKLAHVCWVLEVKDMGRNSVKTNKGKNFVRNIPPVFWILVVMMIGFSLSSSSYFEFKNLQNIILQSVPLMLVAYAQTMVILTEGVDLSLGSQVSLVTVLWVSFMQIGMPWPVAALLAVVCSMIAGSINGFIIAKWKVPPFIVTLGMQNILYSIALLITKGSSIYFHNDIFQVISGTMFIGFPLIVWITALMFLLTWMILYHTRVGARIFGLGGNAEALVLGGVNIMKPTVFVYAYAGFLAAIGGLLTTCRLESGQPIVGQGWEFQAVAATLLGGTSFKEGKGGLGGTILGVLLITMLKNGLNLIHLPSIYQNAIIGIVILAAIVVDSMIRRMKAN
jgi:ribose transport system permease protein